MLPALARSILADIRDEDQSHEDKGQLLAGSVAAGTGTDPDTCRREAEYWQRRVERSDDQAAGLLTACLTVGVVGAGAAGYVQSRARGSLDLVIAGIVWSRSPEW